jgi:hypothetical protein
VPGIDGVALREFMEGRRPGLGGMLSMFTGGALGRMGIFALGIMPYISASIIVQLMTAMVPALEQLKKEGEQGRKKINQYTRYGTVALATAAGLRPGGQPGIRRAGHRSRLVLPRRLRDHAGGRHHVPDVAGRTDHRARHRQRHLADHLRGHHRRDSRGAGAVLRIRPVRRDQPGGDHRRDR